MPAAAVRAVVETSLSLGTRPFPELEPGQRDLRLGAAAIARLPTSHLLASRAGMGGLDHQHGIVGEGRGGHSPVGCSLRCAEPDRDGQVVPSRLA